MISKQVAIRHALSMRGAPTVEALQRVCRVFGLGLLPRVAVEVVNGAKFLRGAQ